VYTHEDNIMKSTKYFEKPGREELRGYNEEGEFV
jgi:hypothetical protein